jgi:hypothetical protein
MKEISTNPFPKIMPLRGSVHIEFRRCGRPNCHCRAGRLHGPYFVRRWREGGRQRKAYVPRAQVATALLAIESRRAAFPPLSGIAGQMRSVRTGA